ncbi:MAG: hypothetical protein KatS3mg087_1738 [Patescibacteria group bacterium]|nr:MAG: hypothetical protein KatS3mg087_1738 [Patescibacteria group bacterium]
MRLCEVWCRIDWGLRNRHKIFAFLVRCAWQVLALRYRRVRGRPMLLSLEGLSEFGEEFGEGSDMVDGWLVGDGLLGGDD